MQKIILDTNVIVSALISNSIPTKILFDIVFTKLVKICISNEIFKEYLNVLNREKFNKYRDFKIKANITLNQLQYLSDYYVFDVKYDVIKDKSDNKFLDLASSCNADFLITGNTNDFQLRNFFLYKNSNPS